MVAELLSNIWLVFLDTAFWLLTGLLGSLKRDSLALLQLRAQVTHLAHQGLNLCSKGGFLRRLGRHLLWDYRLARGRRSTRDGGSRNLLDLGGHLRYLGHLSWLPLLQGLLN